MSEQPNFQIEEYKALRIEIDNIQKQGYIMETGLTLGLVSFVGFFLKESFQPNASHLFLLFFIVVLATLKKLFMSKRVNLISKYIKKIEKRHCIKGVSGWENYLKFYEKKSICNRGLPTWAFYGFICLGTFLLWFAKVYC